ARQFGLRIVEPRPALVPLTFDAQAWQPFAALAGISLPARAACNGMAFDEDLLFTHRGLSGPAILQISSYWNPRDALAIDLVPARSPSEFDATLLERKRSSRQTLAHVLHEWLPARLADEWTRVCALPADQRI